MGLVLSIVSILIILSAVAFMIGVFYFSTVKGQCVFAASKAQGSGYTCECTTSMTKNDCDSKQGVYDSSAKCDGDFSSICTSQLLGSCKMTSSCTFPTLKQDCSQGTWTAGNSCN